MDSSVFSFNIKFPTLINESFVSDNMELSNDHLLMIEIASGNQEAMEKLGCSIAAWLLVNFSIQMSDSVRLSSMVSCVEGPMFQLLFMK